MAEVVNLKGQLVGDGYPVYIIAEIGINHNGDLDKAKQLIDVAKESGCNAVKFQKRTPHKCVPEKMRDQMRDTPWGYISYMEYRERVEFGKREYDEIDQYCRDKDIYWFASCWDPESVDFIAQYDTPCIKVSSAMLTSKELLERVKNFGLPVMISTGMSNDQQINEAVYLLGLENLLIAHTTSTYPCPKNEINLKMILSLKERFNCPIGYSGHEVGLVTTAAAVALGATFIERHITLSRAMWGSDHAASVEPTGLARLVKDVRSVELALGDGVKQIYDSELPIIKKLRLIDDLTSRSDH